jgi:hypothetical protein
MRLLHPAFNGVRMGVHIRKYARHAKVHAFELPLSVGAILNGAKNEVCWTCTKEARRNEDILCDMADMSE